MSYPTATTTTTTTMTVMTKTKMTTTKTMKTTREDNQAFHQPSKQVDCQFGNSSKLITKNEREVTNAYMRKFMYSQDTFP